MSTKEQAEAIVRVIANRCRNLRKVVDRTRALETAGAKGQVLNDEQRESIRDLPRKEALLGELQEIHKKQSGLLEPPEPEEKKLSRRAAKAAKKARDVKDGTKSSSELGSEEGERLEKSSEPKDDEPKAQNEEETNGVQNDQDMEAKCQELEATLRKTADEKVAMTKQIDQLKLTHDRLITQGREEAVRNTLNFFHVADFLRQAGSREVLFSYYQTSQGKESSRTVDDLHMDLLCYFNVMLTSPNGSVPHDEAVDVSTAHCMEYLRASAMDAFEGTSYASLAEIVDAISTCPILTERGGNTEGGKRKSRRGRGRGKPKNRTSTVGEDGNEPSLIVDDPVTNDNQA